MNKKQLRQRILDVAAGVGMTVYEDDDCCMWEFYDDCAVDFCNLIRGLRRAFDLEADSFLISALHLHEYRNPSTLHDFFWRNRSELTGVEG